MLGKGCDTVAKKVNAEEQRLIQIIKQDPKIGPDIRMEYITLAKEFLTDFKANLMLTSIELDDKYGFGIDVWKDFLLQPSIRKYNEGFLSEMVGRQVDQALAKGEGTRDAIGVKRELDRQSGATSNEMFVVFRLPDKEQVYDPSGEL